MTEIVENGVDWGTKAELLAKPEPELEPRLLPGSLRRLARLQAVVQGATDVAQAAINAHEAARTNYRQAFEAAAEDAGIRIPPGAHDVQIDFVTGQVMFTPQLIQ